MTASASARNSFACSTLTGPGLVAARLRRVDRPSMLLTAWLLSIPRPWPMRARLGRAREADLAAVIIRHHFAKPVRDAIVGFPDRCPRGSFREFAQLHHQGHVPGRLRLRDLRGAAYLGVDLCTTRTYTDALRVPRELLGKRMLQTLGTADMTALVDHMLTSGGSEAANREQGSARGRFSSRSPSCGGRSKTPCAIARLHGTPPMA